MLIILKMLAYYTSMTFRFTARHTILIARLFTNIYIDYASEYLHARHFLDAFLPPAMMTYCCACHHLRSPAAITLIYT